MIKLYIDNYEEIKKWYVDIINPIILAKLESFKNKNSEIYRGIMLDSTTVIQDILVMDIDSLFQKYDWVKNYVNLCNLVENKTSFQKSIVGTGDLRKKRRDYIESYMSPYIRTEEVDAAIKSRHSFLCFIKSKNDLLENINNQIKDVINYDYVQSNIRRKLVYDLNISVCPYCNTEGIYSLGEKDFYLGDIDHFINKDTYQLFSMSLWNFIPSCKICNQLFKKKKVVLLNPYIEGFDDDVTLYVNYQDIDSIVGKNENFYVEWQIKENADKERYKNSIDIFKLNARYNSYKDIIRNTLHRRYIYMNKGFYKSFERLMINSKKDVNKFMYGVSLDIKEFQNERFSKAIYDVVGNDKKLEMYKIFQQKIIIFGTNELSKIVTTYINDSNDYNSNVVGYVVDDAFFQEDVFHKLPVYKYSVLNNYYDKDNIEILICVGYSQMNEIRKNIFYRLKNDGWKIGSFIDKRAIINTNDIGEGNIILDGVNIGVGSKIGNANIFYPCSLLSHHSSVGNFNYFSPRASIAGKVNIEDNCFFGINSTVRDNIQIASGALIGAGAYLDHNVCDSDKTIVPARSREINKMCSLRKKNAILISSTGAIFRYSLEIIKKYNSNVEFIMLTDRECEAEKIAIENNIPLKRIIEPNIHAFCSKAKEYFDSIGGVTCIITFFHRLITNELIDSYPCINIHPALLPSFKGIGAVKMAFDADVRFIGGSLFMVDEEMDHGPIIAQICSPIPQNVSLIQLRHLAFVQDVYLMLLLVNYLELGILEVGVKSYFNLHGILPKGRFCNPDMLSEEYKREVNILALERNVEL